jgi:hypothetical protein
MRDGKIDKTTSAQSLADIVDGQTADLWGINKYNIVYVLILKILTVLSCFSGHSEPVQTLPKWYSTTR